MTLSNPQELTDAHSISHKQDETKSESGDSEYNTPPGDIGLPNPIQSRSGPMTWSQTRAHQLAQSTWEVWTKAIQYVHIKYLLLNVVSK